MNSATKVCRLAALAQRASCKLELSWLDGRCEFLPLALPSPISGLGFAAFGLKGLQGFVGFIGLEVVGGYVGFM